MLDRKNYDLEMAAARKEQMESIADYLADYITLNAHIRDLKLNRESDDKTLAEVAAIPIPAVGRDAKEVANELVEKVLQPSVLVQHPKFFSFVSSAVSPYSLAGAILTDIYNPHGGGYTMAPAACIIEEKLIKWMGSLASYPDTCGGVFVSGGSIANMTALIAARDKKLSDCDYSLGTAYVSDQTHSSLVKGLRLVGIRNEQIRIIPTDDDFRMRTDLLEDAISADMKAGKRPFVVVGTIGTTNTGSIDPLPKIGRIAKKYGLWFHIDGAYGGSVLLSDIYRNLAAGVETSDSLSWDTHKWALQTYSCSSIIVRDKNDLLSSFSEHPEYLQDVISAEHSDPWDLGPEMSRPHRALKLWFTLQAMGTDRMADIIDYAFHNAFIAEKRLSSHKGWQMTSSPSCGALTFRYVPDCFTEEQLSYLNGVISRRIIEDGFAYIVTTTVKGRRVLRMCLINGNTTEEDVLSTVDYLTKLAEKITEEMTAK